MNGGESKSNKKPKRTQKYPTSNALDLANPSVGGHDYEPWRHVMNFLDQDELEMMRLEGRTFANAAATSSLKYVEVIAPNYTPMGEQPRPRGPLPPEVKPDLNSALLAFLRFQSANPGRRFEIRLQTSDRIFGEPEYETGYNSYFANADLPGVIGGGLFYGIELPRDQNWNNLKIISPEIEVLYGVNGSQGLNYSVKRLSDRHRLNSIAFYYCRGMVSIQLPENLHTIESRAFQNCVNLEYFHNSFEERFKGYLEFPKSLQDIGEFAFMNCMKIKSVLFPPNLHQLGRWAFANTTLMEVNFIGCRELKRIRPETFQDCQNLRLVQLPPKLESIGARAFQRCTSLTNILIWASVNEIVEEAFEGCTSLTDMFIQDGDTGLQIRRFAFKDCAFDTLNFPNRVTHIGVGAFENCQNLVSVSMNSRLMTLIEENSFDPGVEIIRRAFCNPDTQGSACTIMLAPTLRF